MAKLTSILVALIFMFGVAQASKLYTGGEKFEKDGVIALLIHLNGKMIEFVYKDNISSCLKSKRIASREVGGERVIFSCKSVKALLQEDKQTKYGFRILKVLN